MADAALALVEAKDLGRVEDRVALRGKLALGAGARGAASLVRTTKGLYLVAAKSASEGVAIDLLGRSDFRYEPGSFGDRIVVGDAEVVVPTTARRDARRALALARLSGGSQERLQELGRHVAALSPVVRAFLGGFIEPGELLLAFRETDKGAPVESALCPGQSGTGYLFASERRIARVVLSELGDRRVEALDGVRLSLDESLGKSEVLAGRFRWRVPRSELDLWRELLAALEHEGPARMRVFARWNWLGRADPASLGFARRLLDRCVKAGDPLAIAAAVMVSVDTSEPLELGPEVDGLVSALASHRLPPDALAAVWKDFRLSPEAAVVLLDRLTSHGDAAEPWALTLHERLHARLLDLRHDPKRLARADVELAEHLIRSGQRERARVLLEARLAALPSEELLDLLPSQDADLTAGAGGQVLRIRVFELLADARRTAQGPCVRALAELARLQPLVEARVRALHSVAEGELRERASVVLAALGPGGLARRELAGGERETSALTEELLRDVLPHPAAREGSAVLGRIQSLLAAVPEPDHGMLLEYVEPISVARQPEAARALMHAARLLGVERVQGFVSRGKKGIGLRAYEGPPAFVLVGGRHLDDDPEYGMTASELSFAVATEIAHVAYGHARVTSSEVWRGLFDRSREGLDLLLGLLPLFKSYRMAERAYSLLQKIPTSTIQRVVGGASAVRKRLKSRPDLGMPHESDDVLSAMHEDLVATARVMQLTADRAGLLACRDLPAALRAMLLVRPDQRAELSLGERDGALAVLRERTPEGYFAHQDLAVRIAALLSFYLSDDYARLVAAQRL
ncbi:MAG: hypothetical protein KJ015_34580 [Myxococcales bacterium]|nr:hypothetical protein [Myxococcales bacterium]